MSKVSQREEISKRGIGSRPIKFPDEFTSFDKRFVAAQSENLELFELSEFLRKLGEREVAKIEEYGVGIASMSDTFEGLGVGFVGCHHPPIRQFECRTDSRIQHSSLVRKHSRAFHSDGFTLTPPMAKV